jgi:hypothetical protein
MTPLPTSASRTAPSLLYIIEATKGIDPLLIRAAKNLGASKLDVMREVTQAFAEQIGADGYSADAPGAFKLVKELVA